MRAALAAIAVAGVLTAAAATNVGAEDARPRALDRPLDAVRIVDMQGTVWTAERFRGRVTLIEFWATWCAPCLTEIPVLKRARAQYSRDDFEVLGVSFDVIDRRSFVSWIHRQGVSWPQAFDGRGRHGEAARQLRVVAVPTSYLVDRSGRVVAMNLRGERLLDAIARLVSERPPDAPSRVTPRVPEASTPPARRS